MPSKIPAKGNIEDRSDRAYDKDGGGKAIKDERGKRKLSPPLKARPKDTDEKDFKPSPDKVSGAAETKAFAAADKRIKQLHDSKDHDKYF